MGRAVITKKCYSGVISVVFRCQGVVEAGMETPAFFVFPPVRLDVGSEQLWRDERTIALRPKTFAVRHYLVEHFGQLVTKD